MPLAFHDRDRCVGAAADRVCKAHTRTLDLADARLAAQLPHQLHHLTERRGAERLALRQETTRDVDRAAAPERRAAVGEDRSLLAPVTQTQLLPREQLACRVGVLALD